MPRCKECDLPIKSGSLCKDCQPETLARFARKGWQAKQQPAAKKRPAGENAAAPVRRARRRKNPVKVTKLPRKVSERPQQKLSKGLKRAGGAYHVIVRDERGHEVAWRTFMDYRVAQRTRNIARRAGHHEAIISRVLPHNNPNQIPHTPVRVTGRLPRLKG